MKAEQPSRAFEVMREHGLLAVSAPELLESVGCEQNRYHAYDVWGHAMSCLDHCAPDASAARGRALARRGQAALARLQRQDPTTTRSTSTSASAPRWPSRCSPRLRFSNEERKHVVALVRHHLICYDETWSDAAVRRWLRRVTPELAPDLYRLSLADVRGKGRDPKRRHRAPRGARRAREARDRGRRRAHAQGPRGERQRSHEGARHQAGSQARRDPARAARRGRGRSAQERARAPARAGAQLSSQ